MYKCKFYDVEDLVLTLEIEGKTRCEILNNILGEEWTQEGFFVIEQDEIDNIIFNLICGKMKNVDEDIYMNDYKYNKYRFDLKTRTELGLDLRPFLSEKNKEVNSRNIIEFFCKEIKDEFIINNDSLRIHYEIERI